MATEDDVLRQARLVKKITAEAAEIEGKLLALESESARLTDEHVRTSLEPRAAKDRLLLMALESETPTEGKIELDTTSLMSDGPTILEAKPDKKGKR